MKEYKSWKMEYNKKARESVERFLSKGGEDE